MDRRTFLAALTTQGLALSCRRKQENVAPPPAPSPMTSAPPPPPDLTVLDWEFPNDNRCVVLVPKNLSGKLPLLIALHGMGETTSSRKGAYGWLESYQLDRVLTRMHTPP